MQTKFPKESSSLGFTVPIMHKDYIEMIILLTNGTDFEQVGSLKINETCSWCYWTDQAGDIKCIESEANPYLFNLLKEYFMSTDSDFVPQTIYQFVLDKLAFLAVHTIPGEDINTKAVYKYDLQTMKSTAQRFARLLCIWVKDEIKSEGGKLK